MNSYDIEVDYTTGDSFNSERINGESVGIVTTDISKAKENLKRIKEHYENDRENPDYGKRYELELLTDDGSRTITPFWIGYFEELHGARIAITGENDMAFEL